MIIVHICLELVFSIFEKIFSPIDQNYPYLAVFLKTKQNRTILGSSFHIPSTEGRVIKGETADCVLYILFGFFGFLACFVYFLDFHRTPEYMECVMSFQDL